MLVKPRIPGSVVRFPGDKTRVLKDEGEDVPDGDMYWTRRLLDGSIERVGGPPLNAPIAPLTTR